ncbi:adenine phosphoribosyltransferase [Cryptosporangium minutisporangium]|uniref:Adenine phosphoribosyltransferase n=1 Tax=Cryptosporangium minutisporangium TaxID=113569 RepID=A0ABP6SRC4_9ACTN
MTEAESVPEPVVAGHPVGERSAHGPLGGRVGSGPVTPAAVSDLIAAHVLDVPDFPKPGVGFKDLTPLFANGPAFAQVIDAIATEYGGAFDVVAGIEARGFVLAAAVAYASGAGLVPIRKAGKLPRATVSAAYALEYGEAVLEVHADAFEPGSRVLLLDDVLATGGTAAAAISLVEQAGGEVVGFSVLMELAFLDGRARLPERDVHALLTV